MREAIEKVIVELTKSRDKAKIEEERPILTNTNKLEHMFSSGARTALDYSISMLKAVIASETGDTRNSAER